MDFVSDVLKVCITKEKKDTPLQLLHQLILAFHETIPFQSVTLMAKPLHVRDKPTLEEIKTAVTSKQGGLCYTINTFMKHLLDMLGFIVYHAISSIKNKNDHIVTFAVIEGVRYLVDVANGYPTFEAIPIDFEKESKIYRHLFLVYKFVKEQGSRNILRMHKKEDFRPTTSSVTTGTSDSWRIACVIDPMPRDISFFNEPMSLVYSSPDHLVFHNSLRIILFPKGQAIVLQDRKFYVENSETHELVLQQEFSTLNDTVKKIRQMFPSLYDAATNALTLMNKKINI